MSSFTSHPVLPVRRAKTQSQGYYFSKYIISTFQTTLIPLLQFALVLLQFVLVPSSLQPPVSQTQMNSYHLILPLETPDRIFFKKKAKKQHQQKHARGDAFPLAITGTHGPGLP